MLRKTKNNTDDPGRVQGGAFAIVASKYNGVYVDSMVEKATAILTAAGVTELKVVRVPGAFEIPAVASALARHSEPALSALICLGVILRGETTHAQHIGEAVSHALARIQVEHELPVIHEVLLLENEEQARIRCLSEDHNRGAEAAQTAIEMADVMRGVRGKVKKGLKGVKRVKRVKMP